MVLKDLFKSLQWQMMVVWVMQTQLHERTATGKSLLESWVTTFFPTDSYPQSVFDLSQTSCRCVLIVWIVLM